MKTENSLLSNLRVASPCVARWSDMTGDDRVRFCGQCQKNVYNLSGMTSDEAVALINAHDGQLCARFYQRSDGRVLTTDCPVGAARIGRRLKRLVMAAAALITFGVAARVAVETMDPPPDKPRNRLHLAMDGAVTSVKGWFGIKPALLPPSTLMLGEVCVPSRPPGTNATAGKRTAL